MNQITFSQIQEYNTQYTYTKDQKIVIEKLIDLLNSKKKFIGLYGYAGTGKTTTICSFVSFITQHNINVAMAAPTNKAALVMEDSYILIDDSKLGVNFCTIHKLLDYQVITDSNGYQQFVPKTMNRKNNFEKYNLVVIDECSMITLDMAKEIFSLLNKSKNAKVVFIGDPAQLPPVGEIIAPFFYDLKKNINVKSEHEMSNAELKKYLKELQENSFTMKKLVRMKNQKYRNFCKEIRAFALGESDEEFSDKNIDFEKVSAYDKQIYEEWISTAIKYFKNEEKNNEYYSNIILCWTNKKVNEYNEIVRKNIIQDKYAYKEYHVGDVIIFTKYYSDEFHTSCQAKIIGCEETSHTVKCKNLSPLSIADFSVKGFNLLIEKNNGKSKKIFVISKDHKKNFERKRELIRKKISSLDGNKPWEAFNSILHKPFAEINLGLSMTCHKSQSSTFDNVFIDYSDIKKNRNSDEMKKCFYTACTRGAKRIHILI